MQGLEPTAGVDLGEVKENWKGDTELHKNTWYGSEKVGKVERSIFGNPKSIETKEGDSFKIKETW